ncbi:MAG: hypothetical protein JNN20_18865 [Betaproteobacteria bacterium]|nr:hypothetical protein [Betaproteobacteria bacterium]
MSKNSAEQDKRCEMFLSQQEKTMKFVATVAMFITTLATQLAVAGGDHHPKYGGQVQETSSYDLELVAKGKELMLHVADHKGGKTSAKEATATVITGQSKETVRLIAGSDGVLKGVSNLAVAADTKIIVSILASGKTEQARFTPVRNAKTDDHKSHKH